MFERSNVTNRFFHCWLNCCSPPSGQPGKRYCEYEEVKKVSAFVAEVTIWGDRTAIFPAQRSEEIHDG